MAESSKQLCSPVWAYEMTNEVSPKAESSEKETFALSGQKCGLFRLPDTAPATVAENQTTDARLSSYEMNVNACDSKKDHAARMPQQNLPNHQWKA